MQLLPVGTQPFRPSPLSHSIFSPLQSFCARAHFIPNLAATSEHVDEAIRLFQVSTLHAAQTGAVSG